MRKKLLSLCLVVTMITSLIPAVSAASEEALVAAKTLYELGLFNGTGKDASGNPVFDLDSVPSRHQAVVMLVRLLGKDNEAKTGNWNIPFKDVAEWEKPYVGYAYANGLTSGTSSTTYNGNRDATVAQYLAFVLRALGYASGIDFQYNAVCDFADKIGLTDGRYNQNTTSFTRGDVAIISYRALNCKLKDTNQTLVRKLYDNNSIDYIEISNAGLGSASGLQIIDTPTNIRMDAENGVNFIVWNAPSQAITMYHVLVSENKDKDFEIYYPQDSDKPYVPLNNTGLVELKGNTTYYFKVRAYLHDANNIDYFSAFSDTITHTTPMSNSSSGIPSVPANSSSNAQITQLVLSDKALNITPGENITVGATCIPMYAYPNLTWTSSNPAVATVQYLETIKDENVYNGTTYDDAYTVKASISAVSAGNAVITVTAQNGVTARINVTVSGDNTAKAQAAVDALRAILKFPASLSINSVRVYQGRSTEIVEIDYSAMNGFGGYNRGYFTYSGSTSGTHDYSVIDKEGFPYVSIDINKLH